MMKLKELKKAHNHSDYHKKELKKSSICGCFYCCKTFKPETIKEWIDGKQTALCPICGIDSVLGDASGLKVTDKQFLSDMNDYWFGENNSTDGVVYLKNKKKIK
jgi:hypothetical protein